MVGDLAHYRNVMSLAKLLALYKVHISLVSSKNCAITQNLRTYLKAGKCTISEIEDLSSVIKEADVLFVTRVKKEYMSQSLYESIKHKYVVNMKIVSQMKKKSMVMHVLPRVDELTTDVDSDPRAVYFTSQLENGLYGKMAVLEAILKKD